MLQWTFFTISPYLLCKSHLGDTCVGGKSWGHRICISLPRLLAQAKLFSKWLCQFTVFRNTVPVAPHSHQHLPSEFFIFTNLMSMKKSYCFNKHFLGYYWNQATFCFYWSIIDNIISGSGVQHSDSITIYMMKCLLWQL